MPMVRFKIHYQLCHDLEVNRSTSNMALMFTWYSYMLWETSHSFIVKLQGLKENCLGLNAFHMRDFDIYAMTKLW